MSTKSLKEREMLRKNQLMLIMVFVAFGLVPVFMTADFTGFSVVELGDVEIVKTVNTTPLDQMKLILPEPVDKHIEIINDTKMDVTEVYRTQFIRGGRRYNSICSDDIDNDDDDRIDCNDPLCSWSRSCGEDNEDWYFGWRYYWICSDGIDNDGDGLIDCEDPFCRWAPHCVDEDDTTITLISPLDNSVDSDGLVKFRYSVNSTKAIDHCNLIFDSTLEATNTNVSVNTEHLFIKESVPEGNHSWQITCTEGSDTIDSMIWLFTVKLPQNFTNETIVVNETITDSEGEQINATIEFVDTGSGETDYNTSSNSTTNITSGTFNIIVTPENHTIETIEFVGVNITGSVTEILDIEDTNETGDWAEIYSVNPLIEYDYEYINVTSTATAKDLFKCQNWNFTTQTCIDNRWKKIKDITPGENYTFSMGPTDPGFAELDQSITIVDSDDFLVNSSQANISEGLENITILIDDPYIGTIKNIVIFNHNASEGNDLKIAEPDNKRFLERYSIDPTGLSMTSANVTITATGVELYKCTEFNFTAQNCTGNWTLFKSGLIPGENYTFILTPDDPGFAEINKTAIEDTFVYEGAPNGNFDEYVNGLAVGRNTASGWRAWTFLKMNLSDQPSNSVVNASLRMYLNTGTGGAFPMELYELSEDTWSESVLTWNNQPVCGASIDNVSPTGVGIWMEWNVTPYVQQTLDNSSDDIIGFCLKGDQAVGTNYGSFEDYENTLGTGNAPELVIYSNRVPNATYVEHTPSKQEDGKDIQFNATWTDEDSDQTVTMYICKDSTCSNCNLTSQTNCYCTSSSTTNSSSCNYTVQVSNSVLNDYWLGVCDYYDCDSTPYYGGKWRKASRDFFVQRGEVTATGTQISDTISAVDPGQAFVLFTANSGDATPDDRQFTPNITGTSVTFDRYDGAAVSSTVSWQIIESNQFIVQSGFEALTSGTAEVNVPITAVNLSQAFVIVYGRCADETTGDNHAGFFIGNLTTPTNLQLLRGNAGKCAASISWQVVEWPGANVQEGTSVIPNNVDSTTEPISSIDLTKSFLVFSSASIGTDPGMDSNLIQGNLTSPTTLYFTHEPGTTYASSERIIEWYVVELPEAVVQTGSLALAADTTETISSVNMSRTFHLSSGWNTGGGQTYTNSLYTTNLSTPTTLYFDKQTTSQTQNIVWRVIEIRAKELIDLTDPNSTALNYSYAIINEYDGLFDLSINVTDEDVDKILIIGYNDTSGALIFESDTNEAWGVNSYAIDTSNLIYENMTMTFTANATHLYKCLNWSMSNLTCLDDNDWDVIQINVPDEKYNLTINITDPGYVELTVPDQDVLNDGYADEANPGLEGGARNRMLVQNFTGQNRHSLLMFNITSIPYNVNITNATLRLRCQGESLEAGESVEVGVHYTSFNWIEGTGGNTGDPCTGNEFCWNNRPTVYNTTAESTMVIPDGCAGTYYDFNVTSIIRTAYQNNLENISIYILPTGNNVGATNNDNVRFNTKESTIVDRRPNLTIGYYELPSPPNVSGLATENLLYARNDSVLIFATVQDIQGVDTVLSNITLPDYGTEIIQLTYSNITGRYEGAFINTSKLGIYTATIIANDTQGYVNDTESTTFRIVKPNITADKTDSPDPVQLGNILSYNINMSVLKLPGIVPLEFSNIQNVTNSAVVKDSPQMIETQSETLMIAYHADSGTNNDIYVIRSTDKGKTWSSPIQVCDETQDDEFPNIYENSDGDILIAYTHLEPVGFGDVWIVDSTDDGVTWSEPYAVTLTSNVSEFEPAIEQDSTGMYYVAYEAYNIDPDAEIYIHNSTDFTSGWSKRIKITNNSIADYDVEMLIINDTFHFTWAPENPDYQEIWYAKTTDPLVFNALDDNSQQISDNDIYDYETSLGADNDGNIYIGWVGLLDIGQVGLSDIGRTSNEIFIARSSDAGNSWDIRQITNNTISDAYPGIIQTGTEGLYYLTSLTPIGGFMQIAFAERDYSPQDAVNVTVRDKVPTGTSVDTIYQGGTLIDDTVEWTFDVIYAGEANELGFDVLVNNTVTNNTIITNNANITFFDADDNFIELIKLQENTTAIDTINPDVTDLQPTAGTLVNQSANITLSANVTDNGLVDTVLANITLPDLSIIQIELLYNISSGYFEYLFTNTAQVGSYNFTIIANDTSANYNTSESSFFVATNDLATIPTNITCDGSKCAGNFNTTIDLNCSGSIDPNGDNITYYLEALLSPIRYNITTLTATFDTDNESFTYYDDLYGTSSPVQAVGDNVASIYCTSGSCLNVQLNLNTPTTGTQISGGWNRTIDITDKPTYVDIRFNYTLRIDDQTEITEDISIAYRNLTDNSVIIGPTLTGLTGTDGTDEYQSGYVSYKVPIYVGEYLFDVGCILSSVDSTNENGECWIDNLTVSEINTSNTVPVWTEIGSHTEDSILVWNIYDEKPQSGVDFRCRAIDSGSSQFTDYFTLNTNATIIDDVKPPEWYNNFTIPNVYMPSGTHIFNITWDDNGIVDTVLFEHNISTIQNYTPSASYLNEYYIISTGLAAGTYYWKSYANDTSGNSAKSDTFIYNVPKAVPVCNLTFTPASPQSYTTLVNASCSCTNADTLDVTLYRNNVNVTSENNLFTVLPAGLHEYNCTSEQTQNYTSAFTNVTYEIVKANSSIQVLLNSSPANLTAKQFDPVNITAILTAGESNIELYEDSILIENGTSPLQNITSYDTVSLVNVTAVYPETENYSRSQTTLFINVTDGEPPTFTDPGQDPAVVYNGINITLNITIYDNVNISGYIFSTNDSGVWVNSTFVQSPGTSYVASTLELIDSTVGDTVGWRYYANDSSGNLNKSGISTSVVSEVPENATYYACEGGNTGTASFGVGYLPGAGFLECRGFVKIPLPIKPSGTIVKYALMNVTVLDGTNDQASSNYVLARITNDTAVSEATMSYADGQYADLSVNDTSGARDWADGELYIYNVTEAVTQDYNTSLDTSATFVLLDYDYDSLILGGTSAVNDYTTFNNRLSTAPPLLYIEFRDILPPNVTNIEPTNGSIFDYNETILVRARVVDNIAVSKVYANISWNDQATQLELTQESSEYYSANFTNTTYVGTYNITVIGNDTTDLVNDSESVQFYINDLSTPNVTLVNPPDNYFNDTHYPTNLTFECNATDTLGLANISLYITNATNSSFAFNQTTLVSGTENSTNFTLQLYNGNYTWSCLAYDIYGNRQFGENRSIRINVSPSIAVSLSDQLSGGVNWTIVNLPSFNASADNNNATGATEYDVIITTIATTADIYIRGGGDLMTLGGDYIRLANESFSYNLTNSTVPDFDKFRLTTNYSDNLIATNVDDASTIYLKFFLDVPPAQNPGKYSNNISILAIPYGESP